SCFFSSRRRHTRSKRDWSSDVCSSDLGDRQRDATSLGGHEVAPALDVRIPATVGPTVRVRDGLAETRLPSRYLAMRRHGVVLLPPHVAVARGGELGAGRGPHSERRCHVAGTVTKAIANVQTTARV